MRCIHWLGEGWGCTLPPPLPPEVCLGGLAYQDRTPHNEQGRRPTTNGVQPTNPTSALALLKTCCCFYIVLYFLHITIYSNLHCTYPILVHCMLVIIMLAFYTSPFWRYHHHFPPEVDLFPAFSVYKATLPCSVDHNLLKRALDLAETSKFYPWHRSIWFPASVVTRITYQVRKWSALRCEPCNRLGTLCIERTG